MTLRSTRTSELISTVAVAVVLASAATALAAQSEQVPRTATGRPELSGTYDAATLTPLERPAMFGDKRFLTAQEAREVAERERAFAANANRATDADREAPPEGGAVVIGFEENPEAGNRLGAGNVGGYNWFWVDRGEEAFAIDGVFPTSILIDPPNGRMPPMTEAGRAQMASRLAWARPNDGTAWWLGHDGPGPYDGPESVALSERCTLGFTGAAPTFPSLYNNFKRIVQTDDHVMILIEMVHDARIVRLDSKHPGPEVRHWLGDSIGWWEGDTLTIDTTNFHPQASMRGGSENLHVVERLTKLVGGDVLYSFTVEDPTVWTAPWSGEYRWPRSETKVYEYACHEGNYSMPNLLSGSRAEERRRAEAVARGEEIPDYTEPARGGRGGGRGGRGGGRGGN
jgi:hypothetical protein